MGNDEKIAHLSFIQGVINRMGSNSFLVKGWTVALVAAIFVLASKDSNSTFVYIALLPIVVFWLLDSYYLRQEKLFRKLYEGVAGGSIKSDDFTMKTTAFNREVPPLWRTAFTRTVWPFYLLIISILAIVAVGARANINWHFICSCFSAHK
jgi:hypothetical protein